MANHILIPESRVDAILDEVGVAPPGAGRHDRHLEPGRDAEKRLPPHSSGISTQILDDHGYQSQSRRATDYIDTGVNWGYTGAQLSRQPGSRHGCSPSPRMLLLIIFTGYLIIYNVFQISVTNDIRFYGLLKTIGTTPRQLRRIIRQQALALSLAGIPLGLVLGWLIGGQLTPVIVSQLNGVVPRDLREPGDLHRRGAVLLW